MIDLISGLAKDAVKIATAPVSLAIGGVRVVTAPLAEIAEDVSAEVKAAVKELTE